MLVLFCQNDYCQIQTFCCYNSELVSLRSSSRDHYHSFGMWPSWTYQCFQLLKTFLTRITKVKTQHVWQFQTMLTGESTWCLTNALEKRYRCKMQCAIKAAQNARVITSEVSHASEVSHTSLNKHALCSKDVCESCVTSIVNGKATALDTWMHDPAPWYTSSEAFPKWILLRSYITCRHREYKECVIFEP